MKPDVVFCIGPLAKRDEFQYALRSLRHIEHGNVWIVGHRPTWVRNVIYVPFRRPEKWKMLTDVWHAIAEIDDLSPTFYYSEDDYFITKPVAGTIPNYYVNTLRERVALQHERGKQGTGWTKSLEATLEVLQAHGHDDPLMYDVHIPMLVEKATIPLHMDDGTRPLRFRTLIGAVSTNPSVLLTEDVKTVRPDSFARVKALDQGFQSSSERSFQISGVEAYMADLLPEKSPYER